MKRGALMTSIPIPITLLSDLRFEEAKELAVELAKVVTDKRIRLVGEDL